MADNYPKNGLSREQKTGFVLLLVFGLLAVGLGVLQMRNTIYSPFVVRASKPGPTVDSLLDDKTRLQAIDTDQDGLNDYEELEFFQTSPYLPDTDSDKLTDKQEIDNGTDPLCPEGKTCAEQTPASTAGPSSTVKDLFGNDLVEPTPVDLSTLNGSNVGSATTTAQLDVSTIVNDPAVLRQLLLQSGKITKEQLDLVDDATLLKMASETAKK